MEKTAFTELIKKVEQLPIQQLIQLQQVIEVTITTLTSNYDDSFKEFLRTVISLKLNIERAEGVVIFQHIKTFNLPFSVLTKYKDYLAKQKPINSSTFLEFVQVTYPTQWLLKHEKSS